MRNFSEMCVEDICVIILGLFLLLKCPELEEQSLLS